MQVKPGTLYIVATPIGNLEDVTYRAIRVLGTVDLIAAEDTRRAAKLLTHYGVATRRTSFHEHNEVAKTPRLLDRLVESGTVALISDAGTPLVSDPGARLVRAALARGVRVEALPGPSAVLAALITSGAAGGPFLFAGFAPYRSKARKLWFASVATVTHPVVFFEAPHRLRASLIDLRDTIGERTIAVCRELTKLHEELVNGPITGVLTRLPSPRGEVTVVIEPAVEGQGKSPVPPTGQSLLREFGLMTNDVGVRRVAVRALATKYGVSGREIYRAIENAKLLSVD